MSPRFVKAGGCSSVGGLGQYLLSPRSQYTGVSQNKGYLIAIVFGSMLGSPYVGKLPHMTAILQFIATIVFIIIMWY